MNPETGAPRSGYPAAFPGLAGAAGPLARISSTSPLRRLQFFWLPILPPPPPRACQPFAIRAARCASCSRLASSHLACAISGHAHPTDLPTLSSIERRSFCDPTPDIRPVVVVPYRAVPVLPSIGRCDPQSACVPFDLAGEREIEAQSATGVTTQTVLRPSMLDPRRRAGFCVSTAVALGRVPLWTPAGTHSHSKPTGHP